MGLIFGFSNVAGERTELGSYGGGLIYGATNTTGQRSELGSYGGGCVYGPSSIIGQRSDLGSYGEGLIYGPANTVGQRIELGSYNRGVIYSSSNIKGKRTSVGAYDGDDEGGAAGGLILLLAPLKFTSLRIFPLRAPTDPDNALTVTLFAVGRTITDWGGALYGNWTNDAQTVCSNATITGVSKSAIVSGQGVGACQNGAEVVAIIVQLGPGSARLQNVLVTKF